jgi:hypothetical protein
MKILGKKLIVELTGAMVGGDVVTLVGMSTNCSLSVSSDMEEIATTVVNGGRAYLPQRYSYTLQVDKLCSLDDEEKTILLWQLYRTELSYRLIKREGATSTSILEGKAYVSGYSMNAPVEGFASANISLQGTGRLNINGYGE